MYHDVRDLDCTAYPKRYKLTSFLSVKQFEQQLDFLQEKYQVISLNYLFKSCKNQKEFPLPPNAIILTFDDGLADHYNVVFPILALRNLTGVFFIPTRAITHHEIFPSHKIQFVLAAVSSETEVVEQIFKCIDKLRKDVSIAESNDVLLNYYSRSLWKNNIWSSEMVFVTRILREWSTPELRNGIVDELFSKYVSVDEKGFARQFYMTEHQAKLMCKAGMEIGGHGLNSVNLAYLSYEDQKEDIEGSYQFVKSILESNSEVNSSTDFVFSYPNGGYTKETVRILNELNCSAAFTTQKDVATMSDNMLELPRFDAPQDFQSLLENKLTF